MAMRRNYITINNQILNTNTNTNTITHINTIANTTQRVHSTDLCVHIFPVWREFCFLDKTQHFICLQGFSKLNTKPSDSETEIFVGQQKTVFYQIAFYKVSQF